jgi:hypothetical protein
MLLMMRWSIGGLLLVCKGLIRGYDRGGIYVVVSHSSDLRMGAAVVKTFIQSTRLRMDPNLDLESFTSRSLPCVLAQSQYRHAFSATDHGQTILLAEWGLGYFPE